jgi:cytochrome oxidase Cu insertion factor (SCO1/SenC/PrrC family)
MKTCFCWFAAVAIATVMHAAALAQSPRPGELRVGDAAPDFTVKDVEGKESVKLSNLKGKPVVLLFGSCT